MEAGRSPQGGRSATGPVRRVLGGGVSYSVSSEKPAACPTSGTVAFCSGSYVCSSSMYYTCVMRMYIARTVFGKWSLDILTLLYMRLSAGFQEIRRGLGRISSRVLSSKLARMQETGLIRRDVKPTRPPRV